jgi:hypothetical protein
MGRVILILLILLNLILLGYYLYQQINVNWVPAERIAQVKELYKKSGIEIQTEPDRRNRQYPLLEVGEANLDQMVEDFLNEPYEKTYIYGSEVQYVSEHLLIITDRKEHKISYQDRSKEAETLQYHGVSVEDWARQCRISMEEAEGIMEEKAKDFAHKWLGEDISLSKVVKTSEGYVYRFYAMREQMVLCFNELQVCVSYGEVTSAQLTYWDVVEEADETYVLLPIDEILYAMLGNIKADMEEGQKDEVVMIMDGYHIEKSDDTQEQIKAVPSIIVVLKSGKEYVMNRTAV